MSIKEGDGGNWDEVPASPLGRRNRWYNTRLRWKHRPHNSNTVPTGGDRSALDRSDPQHQQPQLSRWRTMVHKLHRIFESPSWRAAAPWSEVLSGTQSCSPSLPAVDSPLGEPIPGQGMKPGGRWGHKVGGTWALSRHWQTPGQGLLSSCWKGLWDMQSPKSGGCWGLFLCSVVQDMRQRKGRWGGWLSRPLERTADGWQEGPALESHHANPYIWDWGLETGYLFSFSWYFWSLQSNSDAQQGMEKGHKNTQEMQMSAEWTESSPSKGRKHPTAWGPTETMLRPWGQRPSGGTWYSRWECDAQRLHFCSSQAMI